MYFKPKLKKEKKFLAGVGELKQVPFKYSDCVCCNCKRGFKLYDKHDCPSAKISKYKAKPVYLNNVRFMSIGEAKRYSKLAYLETSGEIQKLELQPRFKILVNSFKICDYVADFIYTYQSQTIVEDTKGYETPDFKIKLKLMNAVYPNLIIVLT